MSNFELIEILRTIGANQELVNDATNELRERIKECIEKRKNTVAFFKNNN